MGASRLDELTARARATIAAASAPDRRVTAGPDLEEPDGKLLVVVGIDPGVATTGYGVVSGSTRGDGAYVARAFGTIETAAGTDAHARLAHIHERVALLLRHHRPDAVAVERLFFGKNATTAMAVGQARGVILLAVAQAGLPLAEYTPLEVKSALAGFGRAPKAQMQRMVQALLALDAPPRPDDAADGLALALAHVRLYATRMARRAADE